MPIIAIVYAIAYSKGTDCSSVGVATVTEDLLEYVGVDEGSSDSHASQQELLVKAAKFGRKGNLWNFHLAT